jgi:hypothetical protein
MKDRKIVELRPQRGVCIECNMQRPDHEPKTARCKEQKKIQQRLNGLAVQRWALTDPTYDCTGACREQP